MAGSHVYTYGALKRLACKTRTDFFLSCQPTDLVYLDFVREACTILAGSVEASNAYDLSHDSASTCMSVFYIYNIEREKKKANTYTNTYTHSCIFIIYDIYYTYIYIYTHTHTRATHTCTHTHTHKYNTQRTQCVYIHTQVYYCN